MSLVRKQFSIGGSAAFECVIYIIKHTNGTDEFWFKADDICDFLEYENTSDTLNKNVDKIWRRNWQDLNGIASGYAHVTSPQDDVITPCWPPHTVFISEPLLYALAMTRSEKPQAVEFTKWIYEEVLPSLRRTGTFAEVNTDEPMDTTTSQLALLKNSLDLQYRYMFQTENAQELGRAAFEQSVQRKSELKKQQLLKDLISNKYRILRNMDDVNPGKINNIGIIYSNKKNEYQVVRQQWENTLKSYDYIQRSADSKVEKLNPLANKRHFRNELVVIGEMIPVAHGVNIWNSYIIQTLPHLFGLTFSDTSFMRFQIMNETEPREHYEFYVGSKVNGGRYTDKLYKHYKNLFDNLQLQDVDDCVARCMSTDIWQLRESLKTFIDTNTVDSIELLSQSGSEALVLDDVVSKLLASSITDQVGQMLNAMAVNYPKESETLSLRKACEKQNIVKPSHITGAIQHFSFIEPPPQQRPSTSSECNIASTSLHLPPQPPSSEHEYTVQIPNTPQHRAEEMDADTVSVVSSADGEQHLG